MTAFIKAKQNVHRGASRELHDDMGLMALNALRYSKRYFVNKLSIDFVKEIIEDFGKENPDFRFDDLMIIVEP